MLLNVIQYEVNSISVMFVQKMFHLNLIDPLDISSGSQKMQGINDKSKNLIRKKSDIARMKDTLQDN